jgi:hypothetical protein
VFLCASVCLCFECVGWDVFVTLWPVRACAGCRFPKRVVRRFVLIRRRRKERSVPYRVARGTHGYSRVLTGYSRGTREVLPYREYSWGTQGVLERSYHTECNATAPNAALAWRGFSGSERQPPFEHAQLAHTRALPLRPSLPPAGSALWAARVLRAAPAFVVQVAGASLVQIDVVRACDGGTRSTCGRCWRTLPLLHSLTNRTRALAGLRLFGGCGCVA